MLVDMLERACVVIVNFHEPLADHASGLHDFTQ